MWKGVLVVEDDNVMRAVICAAYRENNYNVFEATNGEEALEVFYEFEGDINLIILDIMMPKINGLEVCQKIRETSQVAIIMLTARQEDSDKLLAYKLGADEYVTKPINIKVLMARSERMLERIFNSGQGKMNIIEIGDIEINKDAYTVRISGEEVDFAPKEYDLLLLLVENQGRVLSRERILDIIWGYDYFGDDRVVDTHIKKIRKKMGNKAGYIQTVIRAGYKFEV